MVDPFDSSRRKLARAYEHICDFERNFWNFFQENAYEHSIEPDTENPEHNAHKIKLAKPIPPSLDVIAADAIYNLRSVLDQAGYAVAIAAGHVGSRRSYFPFAKDAGELEKVIKGRCRDIPPDILTLIRTFKPYKGGNEILCALNDWCNADKHALLASAGTGAIRISTKIQGTGFMSTPMNPVWDRANNEIIFFRTGPHTEKFEYDFEFAFFVSFDEIEIIRGKEAIRVLQTLASEVERILLAIEAEARRIGLIV